MARQIGSQINIFHSLDVSSGFHLQLTNLNLNYRQAAQQSCLPAHLCDQVPAFLSKLEDFDECFVNGDMVKPHIFIQDQNLSGLIDWGDACVTDRHYELGKLCNTFDWDKRLLKTCLEAAHWPFTKHFAKQALGLSLIRQAVGLTQHHTFDVFYQLPQLVSLHDISTLDELADILFEI